MTTALETFKRQIENKGFLDDDVMRQAEDIGKELAGVTTSKMRQYFDDVKGMRRMIESGAKPEQIKVKLQLMRSRLYYDAGRDKKVETLKAFLVSAIDEICRSDKFLQRTTDFAVIFEGIYGYFYANSRKSGDREE
jgi:CRISPR type III-A-associated protein Csm2